MNHDPKEKKSCSISCSPSDYHPGGKCDLNGCYEHEKTEDWLSSLDSVIEGKEGSDKEANDLRRMESNW